MKKLFFTALAALVLVLLAGGVFAVTDINQFVLAGGQPKSFDFNYSCARTAGVSGQIVLSTDTYSSTTNVTCTQTLAKVTVADSAMPIKGILSAKLTIPKPCSVCNKEVFINLESPAYKSQSSFAIVPDNSPIVLVIVLGVVFAAMAGIRKRK